MQHKNVKQIILMVFLFNFCVNKTYLLYLSKYGSGLPIPVLLAVKHYIWYLTIFNAGAYLTFKSIFHKALNLF